MIVSVLMAIEIGLIFVNKVVLMAV